MQAKLPPHTHAATVSNGSSTVEVTLTVSLDEASDSVARASGQVSFSPSVATPAPVTAYLSPRRPR